MTTLANDMLAIANKVEEKGFAITQVRRDGMTLYYFVRNTRTSDYVAMYEFDMNGYYLRSGIANGENGYRNVSRAHTMRTIGRVAG